MKSVSRRSFIEKSILMGAGSLIAPSLLKAQMNQIVPQSLWIGKNDISLAQWSLVDEVNQGKWKTPDFPRIAREDFGLNGVEFVNTLFDVPTISYLNKIKKSASDNGVQMVLIMVDDEGETCTPSKEERKQTVINHRKWIDIAQYLGCHAVRTNCRGARDVSKTEALKWSTDTYNMMLEYAIPANISILIENHGGVSDDADWMVALMNEVNNKYFGILPDKKDLFERMSRSFIKDWANSEKTEVDEDFISESPNVRQVYRLMKYLSGNSFGSYNSLLATKKHTLLPTGTCFPFDRKLFVTVNGDLLPCERIHQKFKLGSVSSEKVNLDFAEIAKKYSFFYRQTWKQCASCFMKPICEQCLFYINSLEDKPSCPNYKNKEEYDYYVSHYMNFLSENPNLYQKMMKELF